MTDRAFLGFMDDDTHQIQRFCLGCAEHLYMNDFIAVKAALPNGDGGLDVLFLADHGYTMEDLREALKHEHPKQ